MTEAPQGRIIGTVFIRFLSAVMTALLLAAAFPLTLPDLPLPPPWGAVPLQLPGWDPSGYGQVAFLAFIALIPLLETARASRSPREAFAWGYLAGVLWLTMHWLWLSSFGWLPVILLSLWFAVPLGVFNWLACQVIRSGHVAQIAWGLPAVWCALEYLRSFGFWAFPWNLLGYSQARNLPLLQSADLGGVYLIGFVIVLANVTIWLVLTPLAPLRRRLGHALLAGALVLGLLAYGEIRLSLHQMPSDARPLEVALVQGGVDTLDRWSDDRLNNSLEAYIPLSDQALAEWDTELTRRREAVAGQTGPHLLGELLVVWPETTLPRSMDPRRPERIPFQLRSLLEPYDNAALLIGAQGRPHDDDRAENGCLLIELNPTGDGTVESWPFSKVRLVPYGEVVPLREVARFMDYPWGSYDISEGHVATPLDWRGHHIGLMVCFDNLFPFLPRHEVARGADSLIVVTNNSWYHLASGIRQHCDFDILRAVELRRPVARASTTGYSHLVDPQGRVIEQTDIESSGMITATLWPGHGASVYLVVGDLFAQLCLLAGLLVAGRALFAGRSEGIF